MTGVASLCETVRVDDARARTVCQVSTVTSRTTKVFEHTALHCTSPKHTEWAKVAGLRFVLEGLSHTTPVWYTALVCGKIHHH